MRKFNIHGKPLAQQPRILDVGKEAVDEEPIRKDADNGTKIDTETARAPFLTPSCGPRATFSSLPAEIRQLIWEEALPRRVISLRLPGSSPSGIRTGRPYGGADCHLPLPVASICYESCLVATLHGRWATAADSRMVWYDPKRDVLLLNSYHCCDYEWFGKYLKGVAPDSGLASERDTKQWPSILSEDKRRYFADLDDGELANCFDEAVLDGGTIAVKHILLASNAGRLIFMLLKKYGAACAHAGGRLLIYFDEVILTGTHEQAVASGMFGAAATPEERMCFISLDDRARLLKIMDSVQQNQGQTPRPRRSLWRMARDVAMGNPGSPDRPLVAPLGGLRLKHVSILAQLLEPRHKQSNLRFIAEQYLRKTGSFSLPRGAILEDIWVERAMAMDMPVFEQAVLFRYVEDDE